MRRLAIGALAFSAAVFAANYFLPFSWLLWLAAFAALCGGALLAMRRKWLRGFVIAAFSLAAGLVWFRLYAEWTTAPAHALEGETREITGVVTEYPQEYERYCSVVIRLEGEGLPRGKAMIYDDSFALAKARPGQKVSLTARLTAADSRYGERYDRFFAQGIYLTANAEGEIRRWPAKPSLLVFAAELKQRILQMTKQIFPVDTEPFIRSLMLGDRAELYREEALHLAMSRAGFMHIVAVSGMHIAFVVGFLRLLLGNTGRSSVLCILLVWLFVLVTGASPSAVRAGIMQTFLLLVPLLRRENDPATSLSAALGLLLLQNPHAACSVSLQLSFGAMAGILLLSEPLSDAMLTALPEGKMGHLLRDPTMVIASSLSVMAFTIPLMALHFGYVSILSPLSNVLGLWAVSLCFGGSYAACGLGALYLPLGRATAWLCSWLARYLFLVARLISAIPFAVIYTNSTVNKLWILQLYALAILAAVSRMRLWQKLLLPLGLGALSLCACLALPPMIDRDGPGVISVLDVGQGQCIVACSGDKTMMIDCGGLSTLDNAGETAGAYLLSHGRRRVDALLLTHLDSDHVNGVPMLLEMVEVKWLLLPEGAEDPGGIMPKILASAAKHGSRVLFIEEDTPLDMEGIRARIFASSKEGDSNDKGLMAAVSLGEYDMLVTGDASKSVEKTLLASHELSDMELLIVGHHGSRSSSCGELLGTIGADTAVISVGYNNYGHPASDTLQRLLAYGYTIYRTDVNGTIEIRIGQNYG